MKKPIIYFAATICVLLLVSCYWTAGTDSGSVRLDLSAFSGKGLGDRYARIWLVVNEKIYPLDQDKDYVQELIPGWEEVTVTLEDIPVGPVYRVWLSIVDQEAGRFFTYVWGESGSFEMSAGDEVAVTFATTTLYDSQDKIFYPIADATGDPTMMDKSLTDVEVYSGVVYTTDAAKLYEITSFNWDPWSPTLTFNSIDAPGNQVINSVSTGIDGSVSLALVVDTESAIVPYNGDLGYDPSISENLGSVSVLDSAFGDYAAGKLLLFRKAEGWGGTYADFDVPDPSQWKWLNRSSDKVYDLVVSQNSSGYAFFAASTGSFRFWGEYLNQLYVEPPVLNDYIDGFRAPAPILSLGLINPDGEVLLIGTIEDGTRGYRIHQIAAYYDWPNYAAYLGDTYLFVRDPDSPVLHKYPRCAGLPGRITGMAWFNPPASGSYYLIVSGDEGLVFIEFSQPV
jgi:hypothetical protein